MESVEMKEKVLQQFPETVFEDGAQYPVLVTEQGPAHRLIRYLKVEAGFDTLSCLTAVDWVTYLYVVYYLFSRDSRQTLLVKVKLSDREHPVVDSVTNLWKGAELLECEVYDMFGIRFENHPKLRRLFLTEDWAGYPLRKDYQDPVNMIAW